MKMVPEVGEEYHFFDDGKVTHGRHDKVKITEVIPFDEIDEETKNMWLEEVEDHFSLYRKTTDYFVKGHLEEVNQDVIFVRGTDGGWFSMGEWWSGRLDVDGILWNSLVGGATYGAICNR